MRLVSIQSTLIVLVGFLLPMATSLSQTWQAPVEKPTSPYFECSARYNDEIKKIDDAFGPLISDYTAQIATLRFNLDNRLDAYSYGIEEDRARLSAVIEALEGLLNSNVERRDRQYFISKQRYFKCWSDIYDKLKAAEEPVAPPQTVGGCAPCPAGKQLCFCRDGNAICFDPNAGEGCLLASDEECPGGDCGQPQVPVPVSPMPRTQSLPQDAINPTANDISNLLRGGGQ